MLITGFTINVTVALWTRPPLVPLSVRVLVLAGVLVAVDTVSVEEPDPVNDVGLKLALVPEGRPETVNVTLPLKPSSAFTVVV